MEQMKQTVILDPAQSQQVTFKVVPTVAGIHTVTVNGLSGSFEVIALASLHGRVRDANSWKVIEGVEVTLDSLVTQSNSDGNYEFLGLHPGTYTITLDKTGYKTLSQSITLLEGYNEVFLNITPVTQKEPYFVVSPEWKEVYTYAQIYNADFIITNTGDLAGNQSVKWVATIDGKSVGSGTWNISLEAGESITKTISLSHPGYPAQGAAKVTTNQMTGNIFARFLGGIGGELGPVELDMPSEAHLGDVFHVWVLLQNIGTGYIYYRVTFYIDEEEVGHGSGGIYPGETGKGSGWPLYLRLVNPGTYTVSVTVQWDNHIIELSKDITVLA